MKNTEPQNVDVTSFPPAAPAAFRFGVAGWSYPDWVDWVYPAACRDTLAWVADYVDLIEINNSFYRLPEARQTEAWVRRTAHRPDFRFTAKINRQFTHEGRLGADDLRHFRDGLAPAHEAGRLKAWLAQFPQAFDNRSEHADRLQRLRDAFGGVPLVFELRHRSWQAPAALAWLQQAGVSVANLDYPVGPDSFDLPRCRVGELSYLRLHGRNREAWFDPQAGRDATYDYLYRPEEISELARRATALHRPGKEVLTVANNHYQGKELVTALELKARVLQQRVRVPPLLRQRYPRLAQIDCDADSLRSPTLDRAGAAAEDSA